MIPHSDFEHLNNEERVKAENEYTKLKLMLEKGAEFHSEASGSVNPYVEREMLNYIMEFERQVENPRLLKVFEKLGKPGHFRPVAQIPEEEIEDAWVELSDYMDSYGVDLDACSPHVSSRELYRFATEELFELQINDINVPGMKCMFIYDEFYPDPVFDNSQLASNDCIRYILGKNPMDWAYSFGRESLRLNEHFPLTIEEFRSKVNTYKQAYDEIEIRGLKVHHCEVKEEFCEVNGEYSLIAYLSGEALHRHGSWKVCLETDKESGYWYINRVHVEGIAF